MDLFFIAEVSLNNSFEASLSASSLRLHMTYSFLRKFLGLGFAGGCVIPLLSERCEARGVTRRNNSVKYYWKISSISR